MAVTNHEFAAARQTMRCTCPHCGADDTRKVSLMYEQATSNLNFRALSMGDQGGATYTAGQGGLQNLMGGRIAPPVAPIAPVKRRPPLFSMIWVAMWVALMVFVDIKSQPGRLLSELSRVPLSSWVETAAIILGPLVLFGALYVANAWAYAMALPRHQAAWLEYQKRLGVWSRSWMCMRCGDVWASQ